MSKTDKRRKEDTSKVHANWPWPDKILGKSFHTIIIDELANVCKYDSSYEKEIDENNAWPFPTSN